MSTIAREFTKEQLQQIIETDHVQCGEASALARIAMASLEAEPVAYMNRFTGRVFTLEEQPGADTDAQVYMPVYTTPPAPVSVPAEVGWEDVPEDITEDDMEVALAWAHGFNQCRADMLQSFGNSEQLNSTVIPDGWVACSERMPEKGRTLALFGKRIKEVCVNYVDEGYIGDDGEFYFFDWEGGPRIDDCHPYDKAIVTHWMYWDLPAAPQQEVK
ncbi:DUF551 domain-containing protein [Enterobacter kobei]|uniref:DUF551 domain-containing protein n=1 Tax=Enterobacter kobei TaxID=208224 RepID=UPI0032B01312